MSNSLIFNTETLLMAPDKPLASHYTNALKQFIHQHYRVKHGSQLEETILGVGKAGELYIFYDKSQKIIGFTRIGYQFVHHKGKSVVVYYGGTYHDKRIDLFFDAARCGLTAVMKYKLAHPEQEMIYLANADTPEKYQFLASLSSTIYPKEEIRIPQSVLGLVTNWKKHNSLTSTTAHPMLIDNPIALRHVPPVHQNNPCTSYYLSLNPDYALGNSLLVYVPLNLVNISQGIKRLLMHCTPA
ncbi:MULTISPECIES: hypothetical protein [unclassified Legionella]|uniref:hypothetical protein n=1 Tax=unclassified Legionella TaxID=2622702 RepID=UPI0010568743|nr:MULTISPECIES: hypothetical protein [unclassified Legionella]MDI9818952.1 hypothetical protein [Legionella sp. PL877]